MIVLPAKDHAAMSAAAHRDTRRRHSSMLTSVPDPPGSNTKAPLQKPIPHSLTLPSAEPRTSAEDLPDLFDDLILAILARLNGPNRHAVSRCCKRLRELAHPTFTHLTLPIQPTLSRAGARIPDPAFASAAGARTLASMSSIMLQPSSGEADDSMDQFLSQCLSFCPGGSLPVNTLCIKPLDSQQQTTSPTTYQVSYAALSRLASAAPRLARLSLPLLSTTAAAALPRFSSNLTSLSLTVSDSTSLDHALQLTSLQHLSISTRKGLLYLVLSQRQIADLARMSSLQTLTLDNVLLNDCRTAWSPLSALTSLRELTVSSPLSAERLAQLPSSLRVLQLPFFSGSLEVLAHLAPDGFGQLAELRCRQAFTEQDLWALSRLGGLRALQCDNVVVTQAAVAQAAQAALARSAAAGGRSAAAAAADAAALSALPVLRSVLELRLTGFHVVNGLLGVMFPNLHTLAVSAVTVPRPGPACVAPLPRLLSLTWPSSCILPRLLAACPGLTQLSVPAINCQQRLEELLHPPRQQPQLPSEAAGRASATAPCWPAKLSELSLGFCSSVRFRPKQVAAALLAVPECVSLGVRVLCLSDQAQGAGPGRVVDDAVLTAALRALPQLERLRVEGAGCVSADGLVAALQAARPRLAAVTVAGCPRVERAQAERVPGILGRPWLDVAWQEGCN